MSGNNNPPGAIELKVNLADGVKVNIDANQLVNAVKNEAIDTIKQKVVSKLPNFPQLDLNSDDDSFS